MVIMVVRDLQNELLKNGCSILSTDFRVSTFRGSTVLYVLV